MAKLAITIACEKYDRVQAIRSGRVEMSGCDVNFLELGPEELFFRAYRHQEFDVAELSMRLVLARLIAGQYPLSCDSGLHVAPVSALCHLHSEGSRGLFSAGELDAIISPRPPRCFLNGEPNIGRLFPSYRLAEEQYYAKTKIFPIMHVVGIRHDLVEKYSWLANSVYDAFLRAKAAALSQMEDVAALKVTLPWLGAYLEETKAIMGSDFWPYGIEENLPTLRAMVRYAYRHGTADRELTVEELFLPSTRERFKV
jgi:hypothetical protein